MPRPSKGHGTRGHYQGGCRDPRCVKANTDYQTKYRKKKAIEAWNSEKHTD